MHHDLDEELLFSRKDRHRQARDAKVGRLRDKLLLQKNLGYTEALERVGSHTANVLEVFFGYLAGLHIDSKDSFQWLANLLYKSPETFEQKIVLILAGGVQNPEELQKILG